jgi:hypothetical protein
MTINKTMQDLLDRARNASRGIAVVQMVCGRGSHGGRVNRGSREVDALNQLVKLEMVEIIERHKSVGESQRIVECWQNAKRENGPGRLHLHRC